MEDAIGNEISKLGNVLGGEGNQQRQGTIQSRPIPLMAIERS